MGRNTGKTLLAATIAMALARTTGAYSSRRGFEFIDPNPYIGRRGLEPHKYAEVAMSHQGRTKAKKRRGKRK